MSELLSVPVLVVVGLSVLFIAFPVAYLYKAARERRLLGRLRRRLLGR